MKIIFDKGQAKLMYEDGVLPLINKLGKLKSAPKASIVKFENGGWTVRATRDRSLAIRHGKNCMVVSAKGDLVKFPTKTDAVKAEVDLFWSIVGEKA